MATRKDFAGLTDTYLDTAAYNLDPSFQSYFLRDPKETEQRRLKAYKYFMDFYKSRHWEENGEFHPAYGNKSWVEQEFNRRTWNLAKALVDKKISFLVKEPWTIKLPQELEDEFEGQDDNPVHDLLESVWRANSREQFSYDMASMGCITGDVFVKVSYDEDFYADGVGEIRFTVLDSRTAMPFFDPHDRNKMIGCRIQYPIYEVDPEGGVDKKTVMYSEVHTDSNIVTFLDDEVDSITPNPLGEMLIVHIKNEPLPYERFGRSDLYDLVIPNKELNEKVSDLSEILAYHAAPVTIVKGARVNQMEKGGRKIWGGIPKDGDVFNLELDSDLSASLEFIQLLKKHMHELSNVPEEALGALQNVSNTSGAALHVQYQPLTEATQRKQINYGLGLRKLNKLILMFYEATGGLELPDLPPSLKYQTFIEWGDALPRDRSIDLADIATEMGLGIESKKGALKRLGEENPDAKLEEIKEEMLEQAEQDFMVGGLSAFGDPEAGPDTGMGTAPGAEGGPQNDASGAVKAAKTNPVTQGSQTSVQAVKKSAQTSTGNNQGRPPGGKSR